MTAEKTKPIETHKDCWCGKGHKDCVTEWANGTKYCHSCHQTTGGPSFNQPKEEPESYEKKLLPYRNLTQKAVEFFDIKTWIDPDGKEYKREYSYPHKSKYRKLPKDFSGNEGFTNDHLFGMDKYNAGSQKHLTIVEGEDDVPAAWQMLGGTNHVVGIPGNKVSDALLKNCYDFINAYESIIVATDGDEAGEYAAERFAAAFPNKVYRVSLTKHNDPQEYLAAGDKEDFKFAWFNRTKYVPEFDTSTPKDYLGLLDSEDEEAYIPTGIEAFDEKHLGLFQGHFTVIQAPEGTGKTELFHYLEYHILTNHPEVNFAACHLEESKLRTTLAWVSYHLDRNLTRKDIIERENKESEVRKAIEQLTKNEQAHLFKIGTDEEPFVIFDRIKYYANVCGCKYIFIEPIQDLAQQYTGPHTDERFLSKIAVGLARLADELKVGIVVIAHENDEGLISDCRKFSKQASVKIRLLRDLEAEDEDLLNTMTLKTMKNRPTAYVGHGGNLRFDPKKFTLKEVP